MKNISSKPRARALGLAFPGQTGLQNAITDVPGVKVGFTTLNDRARGIRTGVTAVVPRQDQGSPTPVWAGQYALNGNGEMTGTHWINDAGYFVGPICITNTHSVGIVHQGTTQWILDKYSEYFAKEHAWVMPVVAETYNGVMHDINTQHITAEHTKQAIDSAASGPVAEGWVGGGNGMICFEFSGGTGTSSRRVAIGGETYTVGVLVQANHGIRSWLNILGKPVGKMMPEGRLLDTEMGSIIVTLGTDAPLSRLSLQQIAKRIAIGVGRGGSAGGNNSGEIFLAFSVANQQPPPPKNSALINRSELNSELLDPLYMASIQCVEEAVVNAIVAGEDGATFKPPGLTCHGIDTKALAKIFAGY